LAKKKRLKLACFKILFGEHLIEIFLKVGTELDNMA